MQISINLLPNRKAKRKAAFNWDIVSEHKEWIGLAIAIFIVGWVLTNIPVNKLPPLNNTKYSTTIPSNSLGNTTRVEYPDVICVIYRESISCVKKF